VPANSSQLQSLQCCEHAAKPRPALLLRVVRLVHQRERVLA